MQINDAHQASCWINVKKGLEDGSIVLANTGIADERLQEGLLTHE